MGNTNSSRDQESVCLMCFMINVAVDTQQKGEAAGNENGVGKENNIIREGESKEYHEKAAALPTHETSTDKEPHLENSEDDKADEDKKETQLNHIFQGSEVQTDANDSVSEVTNTETQFSPRKDELHDQSYKQKGEEEGSLPHDEILKSDPVESSSVATETVDKHFISSSCEEQETPENGSSGQNEEKSQLITEIAFADKTSVSDANDQNVTTQRDELLAGELVASGDISNEEKHVPMSADNQVENGYSIRADLDETPKVESSQSDAAGSLLADNPQITPLSSFSAVIDPEDKCMVHTPDTELISNESENAEKKCNAKETESFMQAVHEMQNDNAAPSIESQPKDTTDETASGDINVQPGILHYDDALPVEQHVNSEENFEMVPEIGVLPTKFIGSATNLEEESSTENGLVEKEKEGVENSSRKEIMEECILQLGSSKQENAIHIAYADGRMQGFESVEDQKECNICEFGVTEDSGVFELNISKEIPKIEDFTETENAQNVQPSLDALAFSNEICAFDQMVPSFHYNTPINAPESIGRLSIQTIPEKSSNGIEFRKSPSFDFGVNRISSESDQTPLLCPEKTPTRSLSVGSNSIMRTEYKQSSLDYEVVAVKEKTIRMERSDSDISNVPLLGLSNKGENGDLKVTSETEQNHVAVMKGEDLQALQEKETSLTSPKVSGKRKPRPSFFTTCICCTAATHY
ncbi:hypothetical protein K7X08_010891 [Anisodus acutangulus]|uniref:Uncharacterized protein n=1 Tax=Anisodus acutangulus TaxID=402998 RepID=A0A9Q1LZP1_9SOLA|nr:hypothetical protein K7X08_010891 [Anisodus acutangulus]